MSGNTSEQSGLETRLAALLDKAAQLRLHESALIPVELNAKIYASRFTGNKYYLARSCPGAG